MKLNYLKLVNFIGIFNGMQMTEIEIDFSKAIHDICLICGDNGSGKSTLFKAMNPFTDPTSALIPNKQCEKDIRYLMDNGDIITIHYIYILDPNGSRKTSCNIYREYVDGHKISLNSNGNVNDAKSIICDLFDIDTSFISLSQLSSDHRGLADMKPSDRKRFINKMIESLSVYNDIYKNLMKKSTTLKTMINSINSKINSLGNIEQIQNRIKSLEASQGDYEDKKNLLLYDIARKEEQIKQLGADDIINEVSELQHEINSIKIHNPISIPDIESMVKESSELEKSIVKQDAIISTLTSQASDIHKQIEDKKLELSASTDIDTIEKIKFSIDTKNQEKEQIENFFSTEGWKSNDVITEEEYNKAIDLKTALETQLNNLVTQVNSYNLDYRSKILDDIKTNKSNPFIYKEEDIIALKNSIDDWEKRKSVYNAIKPLVDRQPSIPKNCTNPKTCPYIQTALKNRETLEKCYEGIPREIAKKIFEEDYITDTKDILMDMENNKNQFNAYKDERNIIENVLYVFNTSKDIFSKFHLDTNFDTIIEYFDIGSTIPLDESKYHEIMNYCISYSAILDTIRNLELQLSEVMNNSKEYLYTKKQIDELSSQYNDINKKIITLNLQLNNDKHNLEMLNNDIQKAKDLQDKEEENLKNIQYRDELQKKLDDKKADYDKSRILIGENSRMMKEMQDINTNILPKIMDDINMCKYQLVMHKDYTEEYQKYSSKYSKIETIKKYASPTTGIQTVIMEMYLNDIISISNDLLKHLFGGEYILYPFVVNENEFRIPCAGKGLINDDISSMSTSQICMISMIISFALLYKSSSIYNIVKLDEMDGGLDTHNRIQFLIMLREMMKSLRYEQCVMISHNSEIDTSDADVICLRSSEPRLNGNIIYNYAGNK